MKGIYYIAKQWFLICVMAILFLPMLLGDYKAEISTVENRTLAKLEPIVMMIDGTIEYNSDPIGMISAWFGDHIGFREFSIKTVAKIKWYIFGVLDDKNLLIGKDGSWFYVFENKYMLHYWQGLSPIESSLMKPVVDKFQAFSNEMGNNGIPFIMAICPDKSALYSEEMPEFVNKVSYMNRCQSIVDEYKRLSDIDIFYMIDSFAEYKSHDEMRLYNEKSDTSHWNYLGAYYGYKEIMDHMRLCDKKLHILERGKDINFYSNTIEETIMYGAIKYSEDIPMWKLSSEKEVIVIPDEIDCLGNENHHYYNEYAMNQKTLLVVGDSYTFSFMGYLFAQEFEDYYFIHIDSQNIKEQIRRIQPDFLVYEIPERSGISLNITQ